MLENVSLNIDFIELKSPFNADNTIFPNPLKASAIVLTPSTIKLNTVFATKNIPCIPALTNADRDWET